MLLDCVTEQIFCHCNFRLSCACFLTNKLLVSRYSLTMIQAGFAAGLLSSDLINLKASSALSFLSLVCLFLCAKRASDRGPVKLALRISVDTRTILLIRPHTSWKSLYLIKQHG